VGGGESVLVDAHGMEPGAILSRLGSLGGTVERVLVVACEPLTVEEGLGLSDPVRAAIPQAITLVEQVMTSGPVLAEEVSK
jgi:hydrogenase maturation protease